MEINNGELNMGQWTKNSMDLATYWENWNNLRKTSSSQIQTIVELINNSCEQYAAMPALQFGEDQMSYTELYEKSNQLAHYLIALGIQSGSVVGIAMERGFELVVSILAVLKSGAAFLPLDPQYALERIEYMIEKSEVQLVLTSDIFSENLRTTARNICVKNIQNEWGSFPLHLPKQSANANSLVYILYTSGSTGRPKGVMIANKSLVNYITWAVAHYQKGKPGVYPLYTSISFDLTITSIFSPLVSGGLLKITEESDVIPLLENIFTDPEISVIKLTPSHLQLVKDNDYIRNHLPKQCLHLIVGGENLETNLAAQIYTLYKNNVAIYNEYGPTEATVGCMIHDFNAAELESSVPIGVPIANARIYLLDQKLRPVGKEAIGEIYIGGDCLALGYYKNKELTQERFINDPFMVGKLMYKTGDHAVMLKNDVLLFKGRIDEQIKLRGYRIELGEIENRMQEVSGINQAIVIVKERADKEKYLVGYFTGDAAMMATDSERIRAALQNTLPEYMIPHFLVALAQMPLTSNGKIDKNALPEPDVRALKGTLFVAPTTETEQQLADCWQKIFGIDKIGIEDNFFEMGGNSLLAQKLINLLKTDYNLLVPVTQLYQTPTITGLQQFLKGEHSALPPQIKKRNKQTNTDIAVIGMECNFPGADSIEAFWSVLKEGRETVTFFKKEELDEAIALEIKSNPDYVAARGVVKDVALFDAEFFGISPKLAELMDPQHRLFLQLSRDLLEKTGYLPDKKNAVIGVFAGCSTNTYFNNNVVWHKDKIALQGIVPVTSVSDKDFVSSRVSYQLNLTGPSVNINTACSTSLVAIAQAVESLRAGQCDTAIAGGAAITVPVNSGHLYEEGSMLSANGHCCPFDADATGTMFSDGVGAVLLKPLDAALEDGDIVYAVVKGVGINNDGGHKGSFTAPSAQGQAAAITMALGDAKVDPADISYIETHGTATPLGDPIEIEGLKLAFGQQEQKQYCAIGSVKSNIGHLTHAAGVAGFIKTVLALYNKQLPPSINFKKANPLIHFETTPFVVNSVLKDWNTPNRRIAGVSSFGVGGTNAHVLIEAFDYEVEENTIPENNDSQLICWSAQNAQSNKEYAIKLQSFLLDNPDLRLSDIAYSLKMSRQDFAFRNFLVADNTKALIAQLGETADAYHLKEKKSQTVFLFPGQGNQYPNMGKELYEREAEYRNAVNECALILQEYMGEDIRKVIFTGENVELAAEKLKNTKYAQPAIFITSYALAKLFMSWGLKPTAFAGHSVGEFVGAHLAGIFRLKDVLKIVAERGRLISELPSGSMLSVRASEERVKALLPKSLSIAAQNAIELCVVSGSTEQINQFAETLTQKGIANKLLRTSHAFHSAMMNPVVPVLKALVETVPMSIPQVPIMSTVTAEWLKDSEATNADYWSAHTRETVQFGKALKNMQKDVNPLFLEVGPGTSSSIFAKQNGISEGAFSVLSTQSQSTGEVIAAKSALGKMWQSGATINWAMVFKDKRHRLLHPLPTYAYHKKYLWVDPPTTPAIEPSRPVQNIEPFITTTSIIPQMNRKEVIVEKIKDIIESASGISVADANPQENFTELGLDSLLLTQLATSLKKEFPMPITFRQLSENYDTLGKLADYYDANLPKNLYDNSSAAVVNNTALASVAAPVYSQMPIPQTNDMMGLITLQLQLLTQQVAMMQNGIGIATQVTAAPHVNPVSMPVPTSVPAPTTLNEELSEEEKVELKKPFGATARIEKRAIELNERQRNYLATFITAYTKKTAASKKYTQDHREKMADPRVVSGFKPFTKEMVYSIVVKKSKGCYLWDIDDNQYVDALNGFGSNFLGYQPDFVKEALINQIEAGYEIGPQHVLAGEVSDLICELTGMERAALCNTGSEAVLGAMRIARTVTGKDIIVAFSGSYHGIMDEVLVRGSKKLKTYPAASGILAENVQNMLILEYGTEETLNIIKQRASEIAAVLVEPVQSRRPEFVPIAFLKELRTLTASIDVALIFDEVITGFRSHLGGVQALFDIRADIATYGKVAGGGISIGIISGSKKYMDALDGGFWQYGNDSIPEVGVTYFAGTFVRHPLALATTFATLKYLKAQGPSLQEGMNNRTTLLAQRLNAIAEKQGVPIYIVHFASLWKIKFKEEYPYYELLFALMRIRNIHIWDLFPCFLTAAHKQEDLDTICNAFEESIVELCEMGFIPKIKSQSAIVIMDNANPPASGARLGKDRDGNPAWFVPDEKNSGKYVQMPLSTKL